MMALNATSRTTGRTKNQALWLTVLFMGAASRHHPAVLVDLRPLRCEAKPGAALRDALVFRDEHLDRVAGLGGGLDDPIAAGIDHLDHLDRHALVREGDEFRTHAELKTAALAMIADAVPRLDRLAGEHGATIAHLAGEHVHA